MHFFSFLASPPNCNTGILEKMHDNQTITIFFLQSNLYFTDMLHSQKKNRIFLDNKRRLQHLYGPQNWLKSVCQRDFPAELPLQSCFRKYTTLALKKIFRAKFPAFFTKCSTREEAEQNSLFTSLSYQFSLHIFSNMGANQGHWE